MTNLSIFIIIVCWCIIFGDSFGISKRSLGSYGTDRRSFLSKTITAVCLYEKLETFEIVSTDDNDSITAISAKTNTTTTVAATTTTSNTIQSIPICEYTTIQISTNDDDSNKNNNNNEIPSQKVIIKDLTPIVQRMISNSGIINGFVTIISQHTTTAITINEYEHRLSKDIEEYFLTKLIPPDERSSSIYAKKGLQYKHNDINKRPDSLEEYQRCIDNGWNISNPIELTKWRQQEPINAHSHLLSILVGNSEHVPIHNKLLMIGQWQSILLIDFDGPRNRTVGIQIMGFR